MSINPLSASIDVEIKGILAITRYRLHYDNQQSTPIEAIYHFTLPRMATVLACEAWVDGHHFCAKLMQRNQAAKEYEEAMFDNKRTVLIESLRDGVYAINIGNLDAGESIEIELRIAQVLSSYHGGRQLTYRLPTNIAPRYGQSGNDIDPEYHLLAEYPFLARVISDEPLKFTSSSHPIQADGEDKLCFSGFMDRDIFFTLEVDAKQRCFSGEYAGQHYLLGYLSPSEQQSAQASQHNLHMVLDRSGSMSGASIALCRQAMKTLLGTLAQNTKVNLTAFGSHHETLFGCAQTLEGEAGKRLRQYIERMNADMGGTEICAALLSALKSLPVQTDEINHLLLITDGQTNLTEEDFAAIQLLCQQRNCILHAIGVGYGVNEYLLHRLTDQSGGVLRVVNPNGELSHAIMDIAHAMSHVSDVSSLHIEPAPAWHTIPRKTYSNLPQLMMAKLSGEASHMQSADGNPVAMERLKGDWAKALVQLGALRQIVELEHSAGTNLAEQLGILCQYTSLIMVDNSGAQVEGEAQITVVPQMLNIASVSCIQLCESNVSYYDIPAFLRVERPEQSTPEQRLLDQIDGRFFLKRGIDEELLRDLGFEEADIKSLTELAKHHKVPLWAMVVGYLDQYTTHHGLTVTERLQRRLARWQKDIPQQAMLDIKQQLIAKPSAA
ncbi:VIT and VWA domain-containing protein [Aliiglaciecola sp. CAU 1673]|uniref:VIT and vWA domain-containing protein n=1 Tax=Aliiglaciecola sp. CAU 1673 TaxID=3032595 RepID=UPI0023DC9B7E|nr:VIT and VWA domain-containing protein [Aliiglaciecola sp. CAU 1673]MDF2177936.1 VIT and VWA domain-containing protein [Aliiglaciecola sp. CAU 1673]